MSMDPWPSNPLPITLFLQVIVYATILQRRTRTVPGSGRLLSLRVVSDLGARLPGNSLHPRRVDTPRHRPFLNILRVDCIAP